MVADCGPIDLSTLARATQLINKTNQFNLCTRRFTEEQVRSMAESPDWWTRWFRLKDKFGDHGLIGVMLAKKTSTTWHVDTWVMSCRVLGRRMEEFMIARLLNDAMNSGAENVQGEYIPTAKNILVKDLYRNQGFVEQYEKNKFSFKFSDAELPLCEHIRSKSHSS
jgi:FkbH-like protein